jgi:hypothetical protein
VGQRFESTTVHIKSPFVEPSSFTQCKGGSIELSGGAASNADD